MFKKCSAFALIALLAATMTACAGNTSKSTSGGSTASTASAASKTAEASNTAAQTSSDTFTERDLTQQADTADAETLTLSSNKNLTVSKAGVYIVTGNAENASIIVDAGDDDKVQLVLSGVTITNSAAPAIYVKNADKVFVTTQKDTDNSLSTTGSFSSDGDTNTDAVIFSKDDLVLNGEGSLTIQSSDNGISGKDEIKITGGTLNITSAADAVEANDAIAVAGGTIGITSQKDGLHAENDEDNSVGSILITGGTFTINAQEDGIQGTTQVQIDGGTMNITAAEGIEATYVVINDGTVQISASDDGINAANKSNAVDVKIEINGGNITIKMGQGDTDGLDSNGDLIINGGTIDITGQSTCDCDGKAEKNGGTLILNGEETDTIPNQMMGGHGGMGGPGGDMGGQMPNDRQMAPNGFNQ